jgi:hypothetical protein
MTSISLVPANIASARLTAGLDGSEWFEFEATLDPAMNLRFAPDGRKFPAAGTVSIRRGVDHSASGERIVDSFRYIESCTDDETGQRVEERFGVALFMAEAAFDRLMQRAHWGLPALVLSFDPSSQVIASDPAGGVEDVRFRSGLRSWEEVTGVTLTQRSPVGAR